MKRAQPPKNAKPNQSATTELKIRLAVDIHLRSVALAHVAPPSPSRPALWFRALGASGGCAPLFLVSDLGAILSQSPDRLRIARPAHLPDDIDTSGYLAFLQKIAGHRLVRDVASWDISDAAAGVLCARLLSGAEFPEAYRAFTGPAGMDFEKRLERELNVADPARVWRDTSQSRRPDMRRLAPPRTLAAIEQKLRELDRDELTFLHRFGPRAFSGPDPKDMLDWFNLTGLPESARMAISQMLRVLPRVSRDVRSGGAQAYPMGGYQGLTRKGSLDSILPTELAFSPGILYHRLLNKEALYYGRETEQEGGRELAYIVAQAGLEMPGDLEVVSRGLVLALARAMENRGFDVLQSFACSRLSKPRPVARPADIHRVLYFRDDCVSSHGQILQEVLERLKSWSAQYRGIQVLWVLDKNWDAFDHASRETLYRNLHRAARHRAWFLSLPSPAPENNGDAPAASRWFRQYQVIDTGLLWEGTGKDAPPDADIEEMRKRVGRVAEAGPKYRLRSEGMEVAVEDAEEVFGLRGDKEDIFDDGSMVIDVLRPIEYVENDFEDRGDVIQDRATGIMWQKSGSYGTLTYQKALEYVQVMNRDGFAGYSDWRLPTIPELVSLLEPEKSDKNLYLNSLFDNKQWGGWSSDTRNESAGGGAWVVHFNSGNVSWNYPNLDDYVRVCRS